MEWLVIIGLFVAVAMLWNRLDAIERRLHRLEAPAREVVRTSPLEDADEAATVVAAPLSDPIPEVPAIAAAWQEPAPSAAEPQPFDEPATEPSRFALPRVAFDFEDIFGRRLPIWAGGIALALAGIFLVRYSIEAGLMTPTMRVLLSFVFGLALLGGAEAAYRFESRVKDPRVRQALAGAGLATLYAGFYLAGSHYGLIASGASFMGLAAVTAAAIGLSFRFGLPCAVLGLIGGFAAPALVASAEPNVPILTTYLALVTAGLAITGQRQGRSWLGYAALAFGFLWGTGLLASNLEFNGDLVAFGLYAVLLGTVLPLLAGAGRRWPRLAAAGFASLQLAALLDLAGQDLLTWGLYLVLGAGLAVLAWRDARLREASAFAAALALWMLLWWTLPPLGQFAPVAAGVAAVFIGVPLAQVMLGRAQRLELWQVSVAAPALAAIAYGQFGDWDTVGAEPGLAAVAAGLAVLPALAARHAWRHGTGERLLTLPIGSAAALAFAALLMLVPAWTAPLAAMAVCLALLGFARLRPTPPMLDLAWLAALIGLATLAATPAFLLEGQRLGGLAAAAPVDRAVVRWLAAAVPFLGLARLEPRRFVRLAAEALLALAAYGALAQVLPRDWLAWACALAGMAVLARLPRREGGSGALLVVAALWSVVPLAAWLLRGANALHGEPMLLFGGVPSWRDALLRLAPVAAAAAFAGWRLRERNRTVAIGLGAGAAAVGVVTAHVLYKQVFAIGTAAEFVSLGMAERTVWEALLAGAAALLAWRGRRVAALALLALSLAHFAWFTLVLHDPLWSAQAVGPWPLANWLLPAYAVAAASLVMGKRLLDGRFAAAPLVADGVLMVLIALLALSELRHSYSGSLLAARPLTQGEDLLRSLLGIVLALLYLAWGSRTVTRSWRIGSLVLMLLAVGKVFVVDAAGLEGLLRIASFMALGFSLIGIGWVYSRQLRARPAQLAPAPALV
jgi:uncharacterized membrane protein